MTDFRLRKLIHLISVGRVSKAAALLCVSVQPEILRINAHYSETSDPGLSLVLFALVRSNPPATITFVDQSGQPVANTSDFLIMDLRNYPWLTNHTLRVMLSSLSGNITLNASNSVGAVQSNLTLAGESNLTDLFYKRTGQNVEAVCQKHIFTDFIANK